MKQHPLILNMPLSYRADKPSGKQTRYPAGFGNLPGTVHSKNRQEIKPTIHIPQG
jgi:hypothetical protein